MCFDPTDRRLLFGDPTRADLTQVPLKLWVTLAGPCQTQTGLVVNVSRIDQALREALAEGSPAGLAAWPMLGWLAEVLTRKLSMARLLRLRMDLSERLSMIWEAQHNTMMQITTKYELAASHRLRRDEWDDSQNHAVFGKCSNPAGHGHNYTLEVTLRGEPDPTLGTIADLPTVRRIVGERVLDPFDHKYLNEDTPEFAELLPTVENMAKVVWRRLLGQFDPAELYRVAIWETPQTYAEYFGPVAPDNL